MARLSLRFLGTFGVRLDGQEITHFRSTNVQGLLLYLSLQPHRAFSRSVLATLFWPEESQKNGKNNLRQSLYRLKKLLPDETDGTPVLLTNRQTVQFNEGCDFTCDVLEFDRLLSAGKLEAALALYQGGLAEGFTADSLEFEDWFRLEREFLHKRAIDGLRELAVEKLAEQEFGAAGQAARRQITLDPWGEAGHRNLILALALGGDRSGALSQYAACERLLDEELGVAPEEETVALAKHVKNGETATLAAAIPQNKRAKRLDRTQVLARIDPLPDQKLFGIEEPRGKVIAALESINRPWLVAADGLGGIGKTSLANEVVHHFLDDTLGNGRFLDIAWVSAKQEEYVTGRGIQPTKKPALDAMNPALDTESLIDQLLAQLADGPYPTNNFEAKRLALHEILRERPSLVVIDNLETVADYQELLPLLRFLSRPSKFLITTRMSLRDESDVYCLNLSELPKPDAIEFLHYEAEAQGVEALQTADESVFGEIYQTIGGNPLALKLTLGQAHVLPIDQILNSLRKTSDVKIGDLYVYIYWQAWQMLSEDGRKLFVSLPMMPNGTFEQLGVASGLEGSDLRGALETLRSLSLIEMGKETAGQVRYRIHRLTETFLLHEVIKWQQPGLVVREPEGEQFEERLTVVLDHWQSDRNLVTIDVDELDAEKEGILKAIQFGLDFEPSWPVVKELISVLTGYMERRGHWVVWHDVLNRAIGVAQRLDDLDGELVITNLRGRILQRLNRPGELIRNYRRVIRLARRAGNEIEEGRACSNLGFNLIERGNYWRSEVLNFHALAIFNQANYLHGQAHTHNHLGFLFTQVGDWVKAENHLNTACQIWQQNNDSHGLLRGMINLSFLYNTQHIPLKAIESLNQAVEINTTAKIRDQWAVIYMNLSTSMHDIGNFVEAENYARLSEAAARRTSNLFDIYRAQIALGKSLRGQKQWTNANRYLEAAIQGFRSLKNREWEMRGLIEQLKNVMGYANFGSAASLATNLKRLSNGSEKIDIQHDFDMVMKQFELISKT